MKKIDHSMSVIIILMICSISIAGGFLIAYLWSVKKGQFNDLEADGFRILLEHKPKLNSEKLKIHTSKNK